MSSLPQDQDRGCESGVVCRQPAFQLLQYTVAGNPSVVYMPYLQIEKDEFTCFPVIDVA
jgi:hypothetical protein